MSYTFNLNSLSNRNPLPATFFLFLSLWLCGSECHWLYPPLPFLITIKIFLLGNNMVNITKFNENLRLRISVSLRSFSVPSPQPATNYPHWIALWLIRRYYYYILLPNTFLLLLLQQWYIFDYNNNYKIKKTKQKLVCCVARTLLVDYGDYLLILRPLPIARLNKHATYKNMFNQHYV